jgi:ubiquinone/menaquinone biosynthesis C-methylase UbiE
VYKPREYWDEIGKASTAGSGDDSGRFATDGTGTSFYQLPKWTTQPQYWEYMHRNVRVLDIGSGNGLQIGRLAQRGVFAVGCDVSFALLKVARGNLVSHGVGQPMLVQWDGLRMPFASGTFDRATTNTVLQHVVDDGALDCILGETVRILRREGLLLVCELVSPQDVQTAPHVKMRSTQTYGRMAARHGFRITKIHHVASTFVALQSVYGRFLVRTVAPPMGDTIRTLPAPRARDSNRLASWAKRLVRRWVFNSAKIADALVGILHLDHRIAGQDEIVFGREIR